MMSIEIAWNNLVKMARGCKKDADEHDLMMVSIQAMMPIIQKAVTDRDEASKNIPEKKDPQQVK